MKLKRKRYILLCGNNPLYYVWRKNRSEQQAGWYPDPSGDPTKLRYWNGAQWTNDVSDAAQPQPVAQTQFVAQGTQNNEQTMLLIAFIFCIISTVSFGVFLIPLAWMIPMSVHCWRIYKGTRKNTTAFAVCTLIFLNLLSGILLLVSKRED